MVSKNLLNLNRNSNRHIIVQVFVQWIGLLANISFIVLIGFSLEQVICKGRVAQWELYLILFFILIGIKLSTLYLANNQSYQSSKQIKETLREALLKKLIQLGKGYRENYGISEVIQLSSEGIEQLEIVFSRYLPQLFYSLLAPLTLFIVLIFIYWPSALMLLLLVPVIPLSIVFVQKIAKKRLGAYWKTYGDLGEYFLESLEGLTTLKVFEADEHRHQEMNGLGESFRKVTMRVLSMQLNSITLMDIIAFGGAALGAMIALLGFAEGHITLSGMLIILLLSAEFFIPLRLLGSYFHIAMNGRVAGEKISSLLMEKVSQGIQKYKGSEYPVISLEKVSFSYNKDKEVLKINSLEMSFGAWIGIVGPSGSGKSTLTKILTGRLRDFTGEVMISGQSIRDLDDFSLNQLITCVDFQSYLFSGTLRETLRLGNPKATDKMFWKVLKQVNLDQDFRGKEGLDTLIKENGSNLSGGQKQRIALARALLKDAPILILDEITSNIDRESEKNILKVIHELKGKKTILFISHRLSTAEDADRVIVFDQGGIVQEDSPENLIQQQGLFKTLYLNRRNWRILERGKISET